MTKHVIEQAAPRERRYDQKTLPFPYEFDVDTSH